MENIKRNKTKGEGSEVVEKMGGGGKKSTPAFFDSLTDWEEDSHHERP
jgi:hypothetical protein